MHSFWILGREWGAMQIEQCSFVHSFWILGRGEGMGRNADRAALFYAFFRDIGQEAGMQRAALVYAFFLDIRLGVGEGVQYKLSSALVCIFSGDWAGEGKRCNTH